jgi:hypothetical protein
MWILPKNYHLSSHFAQDMVESKEDLTLPDLNIESSLMWRSSPSPLRTWLQRWKTTSWFQHLCGRILKPFHQKSFETKLMSSLPDIHVNRSAQQEADRERTIQDIYGLSLKNTSQQLDLFGASLKMWKDTSASDSEMCLKIWQDSVTQQRGEYSARLKLAHRTKEKESLSWPTVTVHGNYNQKGLSKTSGDGLETAVKNWPTPTVFDVTGGSYPTMLVNGMWRSRHSSDPSSPIYAAKLKDAVETAEKINWPTPAARDYKGAVLPKTLALKNRSPMTNSLPDAIQKQSGPGNLNPEFCEWLMGVPIGWTELGSWVTELSPKQQQKRGAC